LPIALGLGSGMLLIAAIFMTVFLRIMFTTGRQHDFQTAVHASQTEFIHLCDDLTRDLAGSQDHSAVRTRDGRYVVVVARKDGEITYDFSSSTRKITRTRPTENRAYDFSGDRNQPVDMLVATDTLGKTPYISITIDILSKPPIRLERRFDAHKSDMREGKFFPATEIP
ncbi:MAG TPA: hypothetical protein PKM25_08625, partial [Candidatus Ozemobacteraceae bacterium]|nr:hypothetical protein [Candidatus Ozemobacteraceae bacterium]